MRWPWTNVSLDRPKPGRLYMADPAIDGLITLVTDSLSRKKLKSILSSADQGELSDALELFAEMESTFPDLKCAGNTRRSALTGLGWEVVSAGEVEELADRALADDAADYVKSELTRMVSLRKGLKHLGQGVTDNLSVVELVWEGNKIVEINRVPVNRLRMDPQTPGVIRVVTAKNPTGIATSGVGTTLGKWVVHIPEGMPDRPLMPSLSRTATMVYLIAQVALLNWTRFTEIFGMPVRIGKYAPGASTAEKKEMARMLDGLGSRAWAMFSDAMRMELLESPQRGTAPYESLIAYCGRAIGKLYTGGNLISDNTGGTGSLAAAEVQDNVRADLRDDDIANEGETVRAQMIAPMCYYKFWRDDIALPYFRRVKPETVDRIAEADLLVKAQLAGVKVPLQYAHERLGIPQLKKDEDVLEPPVPLFGNEGVDFNDGREA